MSDQTRAALDDAIRAHLADEDPDGGMVAHWALAVGLIGSDDDESPMWFDSPLGQAPYVTTGLHQLGLRISSEAGRDD